MGISPSTSGSNLTGCHSNADVEPRCIIVLRSTGGTADAIVLSRLGFYHHFQHAFCRSQLVSHMYMQINFPAGLISQWKVPSGTCVQYHCLACVCPRDTRSAAWRSHKECMHGPSGRRRTNGASNSWVPGNIRRTLHISTEHCPPPPGCGVQDDKEFRDASRLTAQRQCPRAHPTSHALPTFHSLLCILGALRSHRGCVDDISYVPCPCHSYCRTLSLTESRYISKVYTS